MATALDGAEACDRGWVAVSVESSVSGSGPAGSVVGWPSELEWELEWELELMPARQSGAELPSGQVLGHVMPTAIQRRRAPTTLVG